MVRADGRVRLRKAGVRRFRQRLKRLMEGRAAGLLSLEDVRASTMAWMGHAEHTQSWCLLGSWVDKGWGGRHVSASV